MKSSLYNHIRILLISLITLVSNGAAWGQTFLSGLSEGGKQYKHYVGTGYSNTFEVDLLKYTTLEQICKDLAAFNGVDNVSIEEFSSNFYIRWNLVDNNENLISINLYNSWDAWQTSSSSTLYKIANGTHYYSYGDVNNEAFLEDDNNYKVFNVKFFSSTLNITSYKVVCYISNDRTVDTSQSWDIKLTSENALKICHEFIFSEKPVDPFENVPDDLTPTKGTKDIYEYSAPTNITINLKDYNNSITTPSYIRWCFADKNGNVVDNPGFVLSNGDITYNTQGQSIYFGGTTTDANENLLNITVTPQAGKSFADLASYKLVAYLSNELGTIENEALTKEPLISSKYEISFNFVPFASELPEVVKRHASTIIVNDENATSVSLPLSEHWETIKADLGSETVNYLRYYLLDASDNVVTTGSLSSDKGINFENNNIIGNYWLKPSETVFDNEMLDFTATVTSGKIYDYKFVVLLSSNEATYTDGTWSKEPTLQSMFTYTVEYVDPNFDGKLYTDKTGASVIKEEKEITITEGQTSVTINDIVTVWAAAGNNNGIRALFDDNGNNGNAPKYRRVYIRNKRTKELLSNQNDWIKNNNVANHDYTSDNMYFYTSDGHFWTKNYNDAKVSTDHYSWFNDTRYKSVLSTVVNQPSGSSLTLEDVEVVFVLSNDNAREEDVNAPTITQGPATHQVEYYFTFDDGVSSFPGSPKQNAIETTTTYEVTADKLKDAYRLPLSELVDETLATNMVSSSNAYFRWEIKDANGNVVTDDVVNMDMAEGLPKDNLHTITDYGKVWYAGYTATAATFDKSYLDISVTPIGTNKLSDYTYTCYISKDLEGAIKDDSGEFIEEPDYDAKYTFIIKQLPFENVPDAANKFDGNIKLSRITAQPFTINLSEYYNIEGSSQSDIRYVRWTIEDNDGNIVDWSTAGVTVTPKEGYSFTANGKNLYCYNEGTTADLLEVNVTATNIANLGNYKLKAYVSTKESDIAATEQEPEIEGVYTIDFDYVQFDNVPALTPIEGRVNVSSITTQPITVDLAAFNASQGSPLYVRWYLTDDNNNVVSNNNWNFVTDGVSYETYDNSLYYFTATSSDALKTIKVTAPQGVDITSYKIVALVSTKTDGSQSIDNGDGASALLKEPAIESKYIIDFHKVTFPYNQQASKQYDELLYLMSAQKAGPITIGLTETQKQQITNDLQSNNGLYARYYVVDGNGNIQNDWTITNNNSYTYIKEDNYGYYWYGETSTVANDISAFDVTVTPPSRVTNVLPYKVIALLSSDKTNAIIENGQLVHEPDIQVQYTYSFDLLTFEGNTANATQLSKTIRLEDSGKNTAALALDDSEYGVMMNNIDNEDARFYARWYVTDKSGEKVNIQGLSITHATNTLKNHEHGWYWYKESAVTKEDLAVTVTAPEGTDLRDYNVVAVMSSYAPLEIDAEGNVVYEPRDLEVVYTYQIKKSVSPDFDGYFAKNGIKKNVKVLIKEGMTSVTLNDLSADYGAGRLNNVLANPPVYRRFYIRNKETKELLDNQGDWLKNYSSYSLYIVNEYGHFWTHQYASNKYDPYTLTNMITDQGARNNVMKINVAAPSGYNFMDLKNYEVVAILSNSPEYEHDYTTDANNPQLTKGPEEYNVEYVFSFYTEDELTFNHYKGITGRDWVTVDNNPLQGQYKNEYFDNGSYGETTDDIRQGTHEWTYEIYVKRGETVKLYLPFENISSGGQTMEPNGYFRWYDWNTDFMSSKIAPFGDASNNKLKEMFQQTINGSEMSRGLFYWWNSTDDLLAHDKNMASVNFTAPSDDSWTGDVIACDVSKYIDGMNGDCSMLLHEPTLSNRYKFIVRPAKDIAEAIKNSYVNGGYFEDHGNVSIGTMAGGTSGKTSLRLNLRYADHYYFYNYDKANNSWGTTLCHATKTKWEVYDMDGNQIGYAEDSKDNSVLWEFDGSKIYYVNNESKTFEKGKNYKVIAHVSDGTNSAPVASFKCVFLDYTPLKLAELTDSRTTEYIESHYSRVGLISFDIEEGSTLNTPTNPLDNMNPMPFMWQRSHYGYCYPQLYSYLAGSDYKGGRYAGLSPIHGDYTIHKSMNLAGVSENGNGGGYKKLWWKQGLLQDLTHHYTGGSQSGYFLYVDASDESRPIANVEFEGEMCTGSTMLLTAMVADMTSGGVHPQLMFKLYGVHTDANGNETERKLIHSFATSQCTGTLEKWYQVYAKVTLQNNTGVENYQHFLVSIDNYCDDTNGADYAIDDIRVYTQNSKVEVLQNSVLCSEANKATTATIRMKHETLKAMIPFETTGKTTIPVYYRICKEDGTVVLGAYSKEMYLDFEEGYAANPELYFTDGNGERYFIIADEQEFALDAKQKYYVSVAMPVKNTGGTYSAPAEDSGAWGNPTSVCSMYSEPFEPLIQSLNLMVNGKGISRINIDCHKIDTRDEDLSITGALQVPDPETGELVSIDDPAMCSFDWVVEVKGEQTIITDAFRLALQRFRKEYYKDTDDKYYTAIQDATGVFTPEDKALLESAIASKKLYLCASSSLAGPIYKVGNTYTITAIPLETKLSYKGKEYDVCPSPMEVVVEARLNGPELNLGFEGVNYESVGMEYGADGLRVGKAQLENMQQNNVPLHLPISSYKQLQIENGEEYYKVISEYDLTLDDFDVIIWDSNDPTWKSYLSSELDLFGTEGVWTIGAEASHKITNKNKSIELELHTNFIKKIFHREEKEIDGATVTVYSVQQAETEIPIVFHEGYWYKVKVRYSTTEDAENNEYLQRCFGETYFAIKVVPEYVTWDKGLAANSNWLNDDNWNRSVKTELYKNDYVNNGEGVLAEQKVDGEPATFAYVPMKFTKVTILPNSNTPNPYLYNLETDPHSGILKRTANGDNSAATPKIEYDMMVEVNTRKCPYDATKTKVYECERFYGNTCKEIYFKPQAQLRWQHYLTYERAWVDMELETNRWYTLAAPLNDLVAGDMYVPTTGRQETEAFKPITFGKGYNRVTYPIYQRSWDKAGSKVMTLSGGYNADIDYGTWGDIETTWSQWSHVYNDVEEKYEPGKGYSIRVHHTPQADKTLIRLPKDDTGYNYFDYAGNVSNLYKDGIHSADGDEQYRLAADGVATGMLQLEVKENNTEDNKYYLIGNPYMASLKMDLFFYGNPHLEKKYWVIVKDELKSASDETGLGVVGPTQSFFVKTIDGSPVSSITLSPLMTTSNLITTANVASSGQTNNAKIRMSATDLDGRKSNVTVVLNDKASNDFVDAEDVELLHDSNLENVPQLYTVAGNQTAMVNSMSCIDNLPIGVMTAKNETVALTVNTLYGINDVLYLYDAKNNVQTELTEGMELMMETNQHGRYFITTRAIAEKGNMTETKVNCYSPSQNLLVVSTTAGDMIKEISIYDASGRMVKADASVDNISASYNLPQGIYIVKVMTDCSAGEIVNKTQVR
ncbi:MAG: T9SS type A sorting domain-containing protein [Prevotella sp.]|nr:T9SS type A sorting domain-containing protein [Prevotella sp.]